MRLSGECERHGHDGDHETMCAGLKYESSGNWRLSPKLEVSVVRCQGRNHDRVCEPPRILVFRNGRRECHIATASGNTSETTIHGGTPMDIMYDLRLA